MPSTFQGLINFPLRVPAYQRAYAWEEEQLKQFLSDMMESNGKGEYYFGHYILEESPADGYYDIIDGQQRLTTFLLFLLVCRQKSREALNSEFEIFLNAFETVSYDQEDLKELKKEFPIGEISKKEKQTISLGRMQDAIMFFSKQFDSTLQVDEIGDYLNTFATAQISTHITKTKAVAVQIFELQNTRGIQLSLIEKVKAKLMKAIYVSEGAGKKEETITEVQRCFAEIYRIEEQTTESAFRGRASLDNLLLVHLQMVDDGTKTSKQDFSWPGSAGGAEREKNVLEYLDKKIAENKADVPAYVLALSKHFLETVKWISEEVPALDSQNGLIGDTFILDPARTLEFFILLRNRSDYEAKALDKQLMKLWEKLLFTRDFHGEYYRLWYTDDFDKLFGQMKEEKNLADLKNLILYYVQKGFRPEKFKDQSLQNTFKDYLDEKNDSLLNAAYRFSLRKVSYILYKHELELFNGEPNCNIRKRELRSIVKSGISVEHILPRGWETKWLEKEISDDPNKTSETRETIDRVVDGIGNLLITTSGENSSVSNNHPSDKKYTTCTGGSYALHNANREEWRDSSKWVERIQARGEKIIHFMKDYFIETPSHKPTRTETP